MTEFVELTELWHNKQYNKIGKIIREEEWDQIRVAEFCAYFAKYIGSQDLQILYKFL